MMFDDSVTYQGMHIKDMGACSYHNFAMFWRACPVCSPKEGGRFLNEHEEEIARQEHP